MPQRYIEGDRATRLRFLGLLGAQALVIWGAAPLFDVLTSLFQSGDPADPIRTFEILGRKVLFVAFISAAVGSAWAIYLMKVAAMVKQTDRWQPPGMRVPFRARVRDGRYGVYLRVASMVIAAFSILMALVGVYGWHVFTQSALELWSPNQHIQLTPKGGAAVRAPLLCERT